MPLRAFLYLVIFIEGYVVLAAELLAMRVLVPFVGSGVETVSIIIAAVLMPLSIGYYKGGKYSATHKGSIRKKLISNILKAAFILTFGLSYAFLDSFFALFELLSGGNIIAQTAMYAGIFLVYPTFLLGQTVPLISNYFSRQKLSEATGAMLFFSTIGAFFGSIISTLILISFIGVHHTVIVTISLLIILVLMLNRSVYSKSSLWLIMLACIVFMFNDNGMMKLLNIVENNNYSTITIADVPDEEHAKIMMINRSLSSKYSPDASQRLPYVQYIEKSILPPTTGTKKSILIIGAGGFTIGLDDHFNDYNFVDIDASLKHVSEQHFLKQKLGYNKHFIAEPVRAFLRHNNQKYDLIILDAYSNAMTTPTHLITKEFFTQAKNTLKHGGVLAFNVIVSPNFNDRYSIKLDNTLRTIFPNINRQIIQSVNMWIQNPPVNIVYSYTHQPTTNKIYTDDKNTYFLDQ